MAWTFDGMTFDIYDGGGTFDEWFTREQLRTVDEPLGGTGPRYVDIGAITTQLLSVTAQTSVKADRDALVAALGTRGELADDDGRSCTAVLVAATPVRVVSTTSGVYRAKLSFEFVQ
jgi:hypothetical protein